MADIFEKLKKKQTALGQYRGDAHGYFSFPKLEGELAPEMYFNGKKVLVWSINNYLGLGNTPEIRETDTKATADYGLAYPMGARIMSGQTAKHEELEQKLATFVGKESGYLLNYGYQGMVSIIDSLLDRKDVVVYDEESHACILDGMRLHLGKRFVFKHNDMESLEKQLQHAEKITKDSNGGILVITEGVFGMSGDLGKLDEIVKLKEKYSFRILVDDAHGFGTMGEKGAGTGEHLGVQDGIDVYFATFAKAMAGIGAFVGADKEIIDYLHYTMRSQVFAKSLPMPMVIGALKRLEMLQTQPEYKNKLWENVNTLQDGLNEAGFDLGKTNSPVTPVFMKGNVAEAAAMIADLREEYGIFCTGVLYPVVPKDVILIRLIPTAAHTLEHVERTIKAFKSVRKKLDAGEYRSENLAEAKRFIKK